MATQHTERNLLLNLCREGKTHRWFFLLLLKRDKNVWHLQPLSSLWRPLAFLPVTLSRSWHLTHHFMGNRWGNSGNSVRFYFGGAPKSLHMVIAAMKLKDAYSLEGKL